MTDSSFFLESGVFYPFNASVGNIGGAGSSGQFAVWTAGNLVGSAGPASGALLDTLAGFSSTGVLQRTGAGAYAFLSINGASGLVQLTSAAKMPALDGSLLTNLSSSALSGALPALNGSALTSLTAANLLGPFPAISGANLTNLSSSALVGALPAISGAALTNLSAAALSGSAAISQLTLNPTVNTLLPGITVMQSAAGSTLPTGNALNLFFIPNDNAVLSGANSLNGVAVSQILNGASRQGGRQTLAAFLQVSTASAVGSSNENFVASYGNAFSSVSDGGTNTGAGARGQLFSHATWADLQSGATNWLGLGNEMDFSVRSGASVRYNTGLALVSHAVHGASGAAIDALLSFSSQAGSIGVNNLITIGDYATAQPLKTTGTILAIINPNSNAFSAANGIDLSNGTFSVSVFKSTGFSVDGSGNISCVSLLNNSFVGAGAASVFFWTGRSQIASPSDGVVKFWNAANTGFTALHLGGDTASFPAIKRNGAGINLRVADDTADAALTLSTLSSGANQVVGARVTGYTAMTGTPDKATAFATSTVTLAQLAGRMMQLQADLTTHGLIGA